MQQQQQQFSPMQQQKQQQQQQFHHQQGRQMMGPPGMINKQQQQLQHQRTSRRQSEFIEARERARNGNGSHEGEHFFSMNLLDVGPVSREVQLSIDVIVMHFAFNGCCSLVASVYHGIDENFELLIFSSIWGLLSLLLIAFTMRRIQYAEKLLTASMIILLVESNVSVMMGYAPEGHLFMSLWAVVVSCLIHPTKKNILGMHMLLLLCVLNYYLGKSTDTMISFDGDDGQNSTVNVVYRGGVTVWSLLILGWLMTNILKPIRRRIANRRRVAAISKMEEGRMKMQQQQQQQSMDTKTGSN